MSQIDETSTETGSEQEPAEAVLRFREQADGKVVGGAYPIASRLARQVASALGGPEDKYGGIGRNGALKTPEARFEELPEVGGAYGLAAGAVHNLKADRFISDHGDVANRQTAYTVWEAIRAG